MSLVVLCLAVSLVSAEPGPVDVDYRVPFVRGDTNGDGWMDIGDAIRLLEGLFVNQHALDVLCLDAADVNDDGIVDIADAAYSLGHLFAQGPPPPAPYPDAGEDPTDDDMGCWGFPF